MRDTLSTTSYQNHHQNYSQQNRDWRQAKRNHSNSPLGIAQQKHLHVKPPSMLDEASNSRSLLFESPRSD